MSKPTRATRYICEAAQRQRNSGVAVDIDHAFGWVTVDVADTEGVFMQGDDADTFIAEVQALCKRFPSLDEDTAALALADPYVESLF